MLIHLIPRIFVPYRPDNHQCELIDLQIPELGLTLDGRKDLVTRKPYPNKQYLVASRRAGQKAITGILIETPSSISAFSVKIRWAMRAEIILSHHIDYKILDADFQAVTDDMNAWGGVGEYFGGESSRYPKGVEYGSPAESEPRMDFMPEGRTLGKFSGSYRKDTLAENGRWIERRDEIFKMPTIEPDRLFSKYAKGSRYPALSDAFMAGNLIRGKA